MISNSISPARLIYLVVSLQGTYKEADNARDKANSLFISQIEKEKTAGGRPCNHLCDNSYNNSNPYDKPSTTHLAGSSSQSNQPQEEIFSKFRTGKANKEEDHVKAQGKL